VRRTAAAALVLLGALLGALTLATAPAGAQDAIEACPEDLETIEATDSVVHIAKVAGLIDPVMQSYVLDELQRAEEDDALALVIWLNSNGSILDEEDYTELATRLDSSSVPIVIWVGQSGASATGGAAELIGVADMVGVSAGSTIGETGPARLPASFGPAFGDATERLETATIGADEAIQLGISEGPTSDVSTIGTFLTLIPGYEVVQCQDLSLVPAADGSTSDGNTSDGSTSDGSTSDGSTSDGSTSDGSTSDGSVAPTDAAAGTPGLRTISTTRNELSGLPLISQLFHTVASPEVAYLLFALGLGLLLFELYTAGIGVAGVVGAGLLALGCYGLAVLPTRWWGIGLLILSILLIAVDVQTNVPRYYTAAGLGAFVLGTFTLYQAGPDGVSMSWVTIIAGIIGAFLYAYTGMPSMVRTRFSTPTIGRQWMIGEMGEAVTDVSPEGTVKIRDVSWRAITNRATPVTAGEPVRVVGLDRLVLEIEPEEGGAKDYRERG
jgi:membrane-bound serine protease (ClpP class)